MAENVYKSLKGRRYLVVMDDVWSKKAWDDVRMTFPDDHNGSRILLTTRLSDVATYPDSHSPRHKKRFLDPDQSWNLLRQRVFQQGYCPSELEDIGKRIARSCRGLPLAIVTIAGPLSTTSQTQATWEKISRNVNEAVSRNDEEFAEILLSLSYNHLPHHLRPCFLYMGFFPEDYEIRVSKLIKLWVAEGFLKPSGSKSFEEVAEEYLEVLVRRSLVLVIKRKSNGKIKTCSVHDLVRNLCIMKAHEEKFLLHIQFDCASMFLPKTIRNPRHVSIDYSTDLNCLKDTYGSHIRTIICVLLDQCEWDFLQNIRLLRVLDVAEECFGILEPVFQLPRQVAKLFHLRYLALPYQVEIPAAISNLENLQTLIIYPEIRARSIMLEVMMLLALDVPLVRLPFEVWRLQHLRHLVSTCYFDGLPDPEAAHFPLENLQTLSEVKDFICTEEILLMIPNLKKLGICYFEDEYVRDYQLQNLVYLHQLEKLTLKVKRPSPRFHEMVKPVFPAGLKKLTLSGCHIPWKDMSALVGLLPNLEVLKLRSCSCVGHIWETSEGEFRQLKFPLVEGSDLSKWITESSHFPSLKCLVLHHCNHLNEIPDSIGEIPTLELIEIDNKNESLVGSAKQIQEEQRENWGNDALQVRCLGN